MKSPADQLCVLAAALRIIVPAERSTLTTVNSVELRSDPVRVAAATSL